MNFKTMSIKTRYLIFNILMGIGGVFAAIKIIFDFLSDSHEILLTWALIAAFVFFIAGFVFRLTVVKCPFCGDKLREMKKAPDICPSCRKSAYERPEA